MDLVCIMSMTRNANRVHTMRSFLLNAHLALGATILGGALAGGAALADSDRDCMQSLDAARPAPHTRNVQATEAGDDVVTSKDSDQQD